MNLWSTSHLHLIIGLYFFSHIGILIIGGLQVAIPGHHALPEPILAAQTIIPHPQDEDDTLGMSIIL